MWNLQNFCIIRELFREIYYCTIISRDALILQIPRVSFLHRHIEINSTVNLFTRKVVFTEIFQKTLIQKFRNCPHCVVEISKACTVLLIFWKIPWNRLLSTKLYRKKKYGQDDDHLMKCYVHMYTNFKKCINLQFKRSLHLYSYGKFFSDCTPVRKDPDEFGSLTILIFF